MPGRLARPQVDVGEVAVQAEVSLDAPGLDGGGDAGRDVDEGFDGVVVGVVDDGTGLGVPEVGFCLAGEEIRGVVEAAEDGGEEVDGPVGFAGEGGGGIGGVAGVGGGGKGCHGACEVGIFGDMVVGREEVVRGSGGEGRGQWRCS